MTIYIIVIPVKLLVNKELYTFLPFKDFNVIKKDNQYLVSVILADLKTQPKFTSHQLLIRNKLEVYSFLCKEK